MPLICYSQPEEAHRLFPAQQGIIDYSPTLSSDGKTLIFQSNRKGGFLLFQSKKQNSGWSEPTPISEINDYFNDSKLIGGPAISSDGRFLYFSAHKKEGQGNMDLYVSEKTDNDTWGKPTALGKTINTDDFEGFPTISPDGSTLYFTRKHLNDRKIDPACSTIWSSKKNENGKWAEAQEIIFEQPYLCPESPQILSNGTTMIFSHMNGDNLDFYALQKKKDGNGTEIVPYKFANSDKDDHYLTMDKQGDDIIYNVGGVLYQLEVPLEYRLTPYLQIAGPVLDEELKTPIDAVYELKTASTGKKIYGTVKPKGQSNEILLNLKAGDKYELTITHPLFKDSTYRFDLTDFKEFKKEEKTFYLSPKKHEVVLDITDAESKEKLSVKISIDNLDLDEEISLDQIVKRDGKYVVSLREGNNYNIEISSQEGYAFSKTKYEVPVSKSETSLALIEQAKIANEDNTEPILARLDSILVVSAKRSDTINSETQDTEKEEIVEIAVVPLKVGAHLELKDIYFDFNSSKLKEESYSELQRVIELMKENPKLVIEIGAHTDNVGSQSFNYKLSLKRAQSIVDYITKYDIPAKQLISKGYGFSKPIASNDTEEGRAKNRRVELTVKK